MFNESVSQRRHTRVFSFLNAGFVGIGLSLNADRGNRYAHSELNDPGAIKRYTFIDMVVLLEQWNNEKEYDRIGIDEYYTEILGIKLPQVTIPVKPGRNIAMIVEVAGW